MDIVNINDEVFRELTEKILGYRGLLNHNNNNNNNNSSSSSSSNNNNNNNKKR